MIAIKDMEIPKGCQRCKFFRKRLFGNGLDYSYSCMLGAKEFPYPWIRQMEERASDCPLVEIITCKDCTKGQRGHWIEHPKGIYAHLVCNKCLSNAPYDCKTNFCPNCGAKMESEVEE